MNFTDIRNYLEYKKNIYNIDPKFIINFDNNKFIATCTYDNTQFGVMLSHKDLKHIDIDYCYFDVEILLIKKLNNEIYKYCNT